MLKFPVPPPVFRVLIALLAAFLLVFGASSFFTYFSTPTDENIFTDPPCRLVVVRSFEASRSSLRDGNPAGTAVPVGDSIRAGDILCELGGRAVASEADVAGVIRDVPLNSTLQARIFRPSLGTFIPYSFLRSAFPDSPVVSLPGFIYVLDVAPGGASDRAGMKVGDLILRINSQSFQNAVQADQILQRGQIGHEITYDILRDAVPLSLNVTLARFGAPIQVLLVWLSGLVFLAFGSFVAVSRPRLTGARLVGSAFILIGFFMMMVHIRRDVDVTVFSRSRDLVVVWSILFGLAALAHSGAYFPREAPLPIANRRRYLIGYAIAAAGGTSAFFGYVVFFVFVGILLVYLAACRWYHWKHWTTEIRKLARPMAAAWILAILCIPCSFLVGKSRLFNPVVGLNALLFALVPVTYAYCIGRYRLLDLNLRIRRNIQYTLVSVAWGILMATVAVNVLLLLPEIKLHLPSISISGTSVEVRDALPGDPQRDMQERVVLILSALVAWYVLWKVRLTGQRLIDHKYDRARYDYRRAGNELSEMLATKLGMVDLSRGIVEILAQLMRLKRAGVLFFRDESDCCCQAASGVTDGVWRELCLAADRTVIAALQQVKSEVRVEYLPPDLKELFQGNGFHYVVPVRSQERLIGVLLLGEKLSEASFNQEDLEFLSSAAKQASVSIENAFLYEELAEKDRLKHELDIARRIQLASLPQRTPAIRGLEVAGVSLPAQEVGGDFYDYLDGTGERLTIVVGDVSGKGTSAALYMSKVQGVLRSLHSFGLAPRELFIRANRLLCADLEKHSFVTAIGADFDSPTRKMTLARAGHLPLYWLHSATGKAEKITPRGLGLGLNNAQLFSEEIEERSLDYSPGDIMVFLTDGVLEARNVQGEEFGEERLLCFLESRQTGSVEHLRAELLEKARAFAGDMAQHDDQTIVVVQCL